MISRDPILVLSTNGLTGTVTNDDATAGSLGEIVTSTIPTGSAVAVTDSTPVNVTSISLTAGDWDVSGVVNFNLSGVTGTSFQSGVSLTTATLPAQASGSGMGTDALASIPLVTTLLTGLHNMHINPVRIKLAATTTVYLVAKQALTVGTSVAFGTIRARRMR